MEKVAVNAVMAGARPEYFPVVLALAASGVTARSSSTNSFATISIVNGPIRNESDPIAARGFVDLGFHGGFEVVVSRIDEKPLPPNLMRHQGRELGLDGRVILVVRTDQRSASSYVATLRWISSQRS